MTYTVSPTWNLCDGIRHPFLFYAYFDCCSAKAYRGILKAARPADGEATAGTCRQALKFSVPEWGIERTAERLSGTARNDALLARTLRLARRGRKPPHATHDPAKPRA